MKHPFFFQGSHRENMAVGVHLQDSLTKLDFVIVTYHMPCAFDDTKVGEIRQLSVFHLMFVLVLLLDS